MERQHLYERHNRGQGLGVGNVPGARVLDAPKNQNPLFALFMQAIDTGKTAIQAGAKEYDRQMRGRMDDALLQTNAEFEKWKTDYMQTHQGVDALTAQQAFADKYQELSQAALGTFKDGYYGKQLEREFVKYGMYAVKEGGAYQRQQDEAWQKSQWNAQLSSFENIVQNNPNDPDMIAMEQQTLLQSWMAKNPGLDPGAMRDKLQAMAAEGRMNALLAAGDYDGAEKLLGGSGGTGGTGTTGSGSSTGAPVTSSGSGTTSSRNLSVHNYGNVKNIDGKFNAYASRHDGLMAIAERIKRYHEDPKRNAQSISDIIHIYAPKEDRNDPRGYAAFLGKRLGISPTAKLNFNDTKMVAGLIQGIAAMEHGAKKVSIGDDEALVAAQAVAAGRKPQVVGRAPAAGGTQPGANQGQPGTSAPTLAGLSSEKAMAYRHKIDAARKQAQQQALKAQQAAQAQSIQGLVSSLSGLDADQRKAAVLAEIDKITDPEQRKNAISIANRELEFQDKKQKARRAFAVSSLVTKARNGDYTPAQQEEMVLASGLKEEDQKEALKRIRGEVKVNELNMRATAAMRSKIDEARQNGQPMDDDSIFRFYQENQLTQSQLEELFKYRDEGGKAGHVTQTQVHNIWRDLQGEAGEKKKPDDAPPELYAAVLKLLPDGRKATYDDIRKAVSQALVKGKVSGFVWDSTYTRAEAMKEGKMDKWRPIEGY